MKSLRKNISYHKHKNSNMKINERIRNKKVLNNTNTEAAKVSVILSVTVA